MPLNKAVRHSPAKAQPTTGSLLCQDMVVSILDDYTTQMIDMVEQSTHGLSIDDIRNFLVEYKAKTIANNRDAFKTHFQLCVNRRDQEVFDPNRRDPFKRVLALHFVDLFAPEGQLDDSGTYVSRRMLPGLFLALEKMVGSDLFTSGNAACRHVLDSLKNDTGMVIWEDLYTHPAALNAMDNLLMRLVSHFDNPMKRVMWMLAIINNDLADPLDFEFEGAASRDWQLNESGLIHILRHLFRNLRHRLKDKTEAQALARKYGPDAARQLVALITVLDRAEV